MRGLIDTALRRQSSVHRFHQHNLWPFNDLQAAKTQAACVYFFVGGDKMLKKTLVRDGQNRLIGSVTSGYAGGSSLVRDAEGRLLGKTSEQFHNTRDAQGKLVSTNSPDAGLLFGDDDE